MILQVNQATANGRNQFEILENGQLLFRGSAPFYNPGIPIGGDVFRKLTLTCRKSCRVSCPDELAV